MKKTLLLLLSLILLVFGATTASATTLRQDQAHQIAEIARQMGYSEDSAMIKMCQDVWCRENGDTSTDNSYYYSGRTKEYYKFHGTGTSSKYGYNTNNYYGYNNGASSYYDGTYYWYLNDDGYYYRYDKYGNRKRGEKANYGYSGVNARRFWAGIITDTEGRVNSSEAETLAKFILSYANLTDGSIEQRAEVAWCLLNNGGVNSRALENFEDYNKRADTSTAQGQEALRIARDVLFRYYVENHEGNNNVGRVLPKNYSWMWIQDNRVYFRPSRDGVNWDHSLASPY